MVHQLSQIELVIVILIMFAGVACYTQIARRDARLLSGKGGEQQRLRLENFFLAGGSLGTTLTENNTLGMSFAWAGGTWFFATTAYLYGPLVLWAQWPWVVSIIAIAALIPRIITRIKSRTIHGFLGGHYGARTQTAAAIATSIGYVVNAGFEIFWPSLLFSLVLGDQSLAFPVALGVAAVIGSYCAIGGYRSNATVDQPHNIIGVISLAVLVVLISRALHITGPFALAVYSFGLGSFVYCGLGLWGIFPRKPSQRFLNVVAIVFAIASFLLLHLFLRPDVGDPRTQQSILTVGKAPPVFFILGMLTFQVFFNVVDMQNWQQIAANENIQPRSRESWRAIAWSVVRASLYLFWFPALGGILLGCEMRLITGVDQSSMFPLAFGAALPDKGLILRGLILGGLLFSFLSTSMSTIDSLLMSAIQTLTYDVLGKKSVEQALSARDRNSSDVVELENRISRTARAWLIPMAILMAGLFYVLYRGFSDNVLLFQPVMYSMPLSLLAPVLVALFGSDDLIARAGPGAFVGIVLALVTGAAMTFGLVAPDQALPCVRWLLPDVTAGNLTDWLPCLMPIVANLVSIISVAVSILLCKGSNANLEGGR
jgi:hypothetical protein